ncbi:hypothetical protein TorRG33x02_245120 [Trema orientale]|uniref:Uncharacterized protein n=1 Tax=Trema orientale TaxID=63057 RepID=A0A2P5DQ56_TREOI|nr:hypothetical protein TorRG33x02_245120 [Trema orientale]
MTTQTENSDKKILIGGLAIPNENGPDVTSSPITTKQVLSPLGLTPSSLPQVITFSVGSDNSSSTKQRQGEISLKKLVRTASQERLNSENLNHGAEKRKTRINEDRAEEVSKRVAFGNLSNILGSEETGAQHHREP